MTEPNRDEPSLPNSHSNPGPRSFRRRPYGLPDPTLPSPGIFGQPSCRVPAAPPGLTLWEALRRLVDDYLGVRWVLDIQSERQAVLRKVDEALEFQLSIDLTRPDCPYATLVIHPVDDTLAEKVESVLLEYRQLVRETTDLNIGYGHEIDPRDPERLLNFKLSVLNRWKPIPPRSHEGQIARFLLWNVDTLLWLRAQARAYGN